MFNYSGWVMGGIISGYKNGEISYCETTDRAERYKANGTLTQAQAEEVAMACPQPSEEPEIIEDETEVIEDETVIKETKSGGENVE